MNKFVAKISVFLIVVAFSNFAKAPEEGQYPLSEIKKLDLQKAGLLISQKDIYNPSGISLIDALVNVNGCTGSFVSAEGLIITNHHCAFAGVNAASTTEHNYLEDGFLAESKEKEIPAKGYKVKITESYEDVSEQILNAIEGVDNLEERSKIITKVMKELGEKATDKKNSIEGKVSEMFAGQSYVLFKYRIIEDVRLVYVPPRTIGEFGGERDNWVWPRHTGDFTFMRAYVAPNGSSAEYSKENIPFVPKKYLEVNPKGVEEGDFAFVLGYPGRTYRNQPSQFIEEQYNYQLPYISNLYEWTINLIEAKTDGNEEMSLAYSTHIKRLSNTMKNYKGKIQGLRNTELLKAKQAEEKEIAEFVNKSETLSNKYGNLFTELNDVYSKRMKLAKANLWFGTLYRLSDYFKLARFIVQNAEEKEKENSKRKTAFKDENIEKFILKFDETFRISMKSIERDFLVRMLNDATKFSESSRIKAVDSFLFSKMKKEDIVKFVDNNFIASKIMDKENFKSLLTKSLDELKQLDNSLIKFALELNEQNKLLNSENDKIDGALSKLLPEFNEVKKDWKNTRFIPDANGTLRFTYGYIKGYSPKDAIYSSPITSLKGIIEKSYLGSEYSIPPKLKELYVAKDFGQFYNAKLKSIPVALLYNMDTTGGNSGSPILDAQGKLIGVNFDRAYEATINDFAWNDDYSRSIGVDIRYILWVTQKLGGANYLLEEMGVKTDKN